MGARYPGQEAEQGQRVSGGQRWLFTKCATETPCSEGHLPTLAWAGQGARSTPSPHLHTATGQGGGSRGHLLPASTQEAARLCDLPRVSGGPPVRGSPCPHAWYVRPGGPSEVGWGFLGAHRLGCRSPVAGLWAGQPLFTQVWRAGQGTASVQRQERGRRHASPDCGSGTPKLHGR